MPNGSMWTSPHQQAPSSFHTEKRVENSVPPSITRAIRLHSAHSPHSSVIWYHKHERRAKIYFNGAHRAPYKIQCPHSSPNSPPAEHLFETPALCSSLLSGNCWGVLKKAHVSWLSGFAEMPSFPTQHISVILLLAHAWLTIQSPRGAIPKYIQLLTCWIHPCLPYSIWRCSQILAMIEIGRLKLPSSVDFTWGNQSDTLKEVTIQVVSSKTFAI